MYFQVKIAKFFFYGGLRSKNFTVVPSFLPDIFDVVACELL